MIEERRLKKEIEVPEGVQAEIADSFVTIKGPLGELKKKVNDPTIKVEKKDKSLVISPKRLAKRQKMLINTMRAHIINMIKGVQDGFVFKLKVCSGHFPMSVSVEGDKVVIKNFFGEKVPRFAKIMPGVKVEVKGDIVTVSGPDKEAVGQTASNIEISTSIKNRDRRVFQDGVWLIEKAGKKVGEL